MECSERTETWRPIAGWQGWYEVSDLGQVRSLDRWFINAVGARRFYPGRVLAPVRDGPYLVVTLSRPGERLREAVHVLVLTAFDRPRRPGEQCRHGPRGPLSNCWPEDLCWGTNAENAADRARDGTNGNGERNRSAKLTEQAVRDCRRRRAAGERAVALAAEYGVSRSAIDRAVTGRKWAHVT